MKHQIKLTNAAALLLHSLLSQIGWAAGIDDIIHAGDVLVDKLGDVKPKFSDETKGVLDAGWLAEEKEYELSEKQRDACKRCIGKLYEKITPGKPIRILARAFGFGSD
jgi:hypothetical protein